MTADLGITGFLTSHYLIFQSLVELSVVAVVRTRTGKQTPVALATGEAWGHKTAWEFGFPGRPLGNPALLPSCCVT